MKTMTAKQYTDSVQSENDLQVSICQWLDVFERRGWLIYFSVPNELPRPSMLVKLIGKAAVDKIYAMIGAVLNLRGRKRGAPDLVVQIAHGPVIYIECKRAKTGTLSKEQRAFRDWIGAHAAPQTSIWLEVRSLDHVESIIAPILIEKTRRGVMTL